MADKGAGFKKELKGRFSATGFDGFNELEKLSLLLSFATSGRDVRPVAAELLGRFGSLKAVMDATAAQLAKSAIGENGATFVLLLKECAGLYLRDSLIGKGVDSYIDLIEYLSLTLCAERIEKFLAVYLDADSLFIAVETLHEGTINRTAVYPRKAIELAIACKAASVIFVHNHPSGDPTPSRADLELGALLEEAASAIGLGVIDHIIIGHNAHFSANGICK